MKARILNMDDVRARVEANPESDGSSVPLPDQLLTLQERGIAGIRADPVQPVQRPPVSPPPGDPMDDSTKAPSEWAMKRARTLVDAVRAADTDEPGQLWMLGQTIDAAREVGHRQAVEETAIASIHKALAAQRASIVAFLRTAAEEGCDPWMSYCADLLATGSKP
jgi:hypothetical protein